MCNENNLVCVSRDGYIVIEANESRIIKVMIQEDYKFGYVFDGLIDGVSYDNIDGASLEIIGMREAEGRKLCVIGTDKNGRVQYEIFGHRK